MTNNISADRISFDSVSDVHDVGYDSMGNAYCRKLDQHQWKYGDEHWAHRSKQGYITFGDKHLGMAVTHKVEVFPGEGYIAFWTRMKKAEKSGNIDVMGTSAYSTKDAAILVKEIGEAPDKKIMDQSALVGMSYHVDGKDVYPHGGAAKRGLAGVGIGVIALACVAIYMLLRGGKK